MDVSDQLIADLVEMLVDFPIEQREQALQEWQGDARQRHPDHRNTILNITVLFKIGAISVTHNEQHITGNGNSTAMNTSGKVHQTTNSGECQFAQPIADARGMLPSFDQDMSTKLQGLLDELEANLSAKDTAASTSVLDKIQAVCKAIGPLEQGVYYACKTAIDLA